MSYCRFNSDDFKSDVYVYSDVAGGYTIHVAVNKVVGEVPKLLSLDADSDEWQKRYSEQRAFLNDAKRENIGLSHDGECFRGLELEDCIDTLKMLKDVGYQVPDYTIPNLESELVPQEAK